MKSLKELYRIGAGPSSSHTLGPRKAAETFKLKNPDAARYRVTLYGSLAATGEGHLTNATIADVMNPKKTEFVWKPEVVLSMHPNGMDFEALDADATVTGRWRVYSVGGGALRDETTAVEAPVNTYNLDTMDSIVAWTEKTGRTIWQYAEEHEGSDLWEFLAEIWDAMQKSIESGITTEGALPGVLRLSRKAPSYFMKAKWCNSQLKRSALLSAFALGVAEENASGGIVVTAPTCGSCGVVPAILRYTQEAQNCGDDEILRALATAGIIGNIVKSNASISGAEVGCQGEIGTACAMAAAAAAQLMGGSAKQIEYAAEMGIEHHLGLTCDPVAGLVQIPCIERNAFAAARALDCAEFAFLSDGVHRISFDDVVETMKMTGQDLQHHYRETSTGGLAIVYQVQPPKVGNRD